MEEQKWMGEIKDNRKKNNKASIGSLKWLIKLYSSTKTDQGGNGEKLK